MNWNFIFPLAMALGITYILKKSSDEIAYLAATILLVSLVLSLMMAPWQIQIALLAGVLVSNTRLLQLAKSLLKIGSTQTVDLEELNHNSITLEPKTKTSLIPQIFLFSPQQAVKLTKDSLSLNHLQPNDQLRYRGLNYVPEIPIAKPQAIELKPLETEVIGKYRGQVCKISNSEDLSEIKPNFELKYRGVTITNSQSLIPLIEEDQRKE